MRDRQEESDPGDSPEAIPTVTIPRTILRAGLGGLLILAGLEVLEHFLERYVSEAFALSIPVVFGSITVTAITYFVLRRQAALHQRAVEEIIQRERAERAQREAEEKYRDIFENAVEGIFQTTRDGKFITGNPALASMLGYESPEELIRERTDIEGSHYVHPERRVEFKTLPDEHDTVRGFEFEAYRKDGGQVWMSDNVRAVRDASGRLLYYEGTVQDITEQKQAQNALRESEERYRELFENAIDAFYVHDLNGYYISVNRAAEQLSGYSREEILGRHFSEFLTPESIELVKGQLSRKLMEMGETNYEAEVLAKDGRRVPVEVSSRLVFEHGQPVAVQGNARDISERKRAEGARAQFKWIVESSDDAIIGKTLDGIIVSWNSAAQKIYGYSADEVIGRPIAVLVPSDRINEVPKILAKLRKGEGLSHYETVRRRKDGELIDVSLTVSPVRDATNRLVGASTIARDITMNKRAENVMRTFSRRVIEAQEAERQHIARELHDQIGQVLTAVRMSLQSIQTLCLAPACGPHVTESLATVDEALTRVRELSLELRPSLLDDLGLTAALRWYVDRFAQRTGIVGHVAGEFEYAGRLPRDLETACFRIAQEALTNVARHSPASNVDVILERSNKELQLTIKDDGAGFDVDELLQNGTSAATLGLHGMEERALAVGGRLEIKSAHGKGTRVRARFPLAERV